MLKFSKKVEYALISMLYMAERSQGELTTSREISESFNIPQELIGKVLQALAKHGCITSVQGVKGGYQLTRLPGEILLTEILNAVHGPVRVVNCVDDPEECGCDQFDFCNMRNPMETLQFKLIEFFNSISLRDLHNNSIDIQELTRKHGARKSIPVQLVEPANAEETR